MAATETKGYERASFGIQDRGARFINCALRDSFLFNVPHLITPAPLSSRPQQRAVMKSATLVSKEWQKTENCLILNSVSSKAGVY